MFYRFRLFIFVSLISVGALANDPFKLAREGKWDEVFKMLDEGTADVNEKNGDDETLLDIAIILEDGDAANELVRRAIEAQDLNEDPLEFMDAQAFVSPDEESPAWPRRVMTPAGPQPTARRGLDFSQDDENAATSIFDCSIVISPISK
jgi:hypothetical protein